MNTQQLEVLIQLIEKEKEMSKKDDNKMSSRIPVEVFDCKPNVFKKVLTSLLI